MSGGGIILLPVAAVGLAAVGAVLVAAGAAVLVANAASAAADGLANAAGRAGEKLETKAEDMASAQAAALRWEGTAAEVVGLNARIRMAAHRAHAAGVPVDLPPPLDLTGRTIAEMAQQVQSARQRLHAALRELDAATARTEWSRLVSRQPRAAAGAPDTAQALAGYQAALEQRYEVHSGQTTAAPVDLEDEVKQILRRLDPDASTEEREQALTAAAHVHGKTDPSDAAAYLSALRRKVTQDINPRVMERRLAAQWLQALELPVVTDAARLANPPSPVPTTAAKLRSVVEGREPLSAALREEGGQAVAWAAEVTRRRFVHDLVKTCLNEQGYIVEAEYGEDKGSGLRLSRSDWYGEHSADIWVDADGRIHGRVVRDRESAGDEADMRDRTRCDTFNGDLHRLGRSLGAQRHEARVIIDATHKPQLRSKDDGRPDSSNTNAPKHRTHGKG